MINKENDNEKICDEIARAILADENDGRAAKEHLAAGRAIYYMDDEHPGELIRHWPSGRREIVSIDTNNNVSVIRAIEACHDTSLSAGDIGAGKEPFAVFTTDFVSKKVRDFVFSKGQPLLYESETPGEIVREWADGRREIVCPGTRFAQLTSRIQQAFAGLTEEERNSLIDEALASVRAEKANKP